MMTRFFHWLGDGVRAVRAAGAELVWPRTCATCGELPDAGDGLCAACAATLAPLWPREPGVSCGRCAAPRRAEPGEIPGDERQRGCRDCRRLDPALRQIHAAFAYEGALAVALMRLKWQGRDDLATPLGALLAPLLAAALSRCDAVVPVPLHPSRLRARGYNQATLLLQAALCTRPCARLAPPVVTGLLRRTVATAPARDHSARARQLRVAGAFAVPDRYQPNLRARYPRILLIDDVVTTGATVSACAAALKAAGATHIEAVALLRAAP